jgi:TRAP-type C4-dicarboxylate transport system permease small subunit
VPVWARAVRRISTLLGVVAAGLILLAVAVVCYMIFVRAVLGQSSIWQTEFATFAIVASTFLGAPYILLTRGHVNVDLLPLMLRTSRRRVLYLVGGVISLLFCGAFLYASIPWWYEAWTSGQTTASIWRAPLWVPYLAVPVGLAQLCLQMLTEMWLVLRGVELPFGLGADEGL